LSPVIQIAQPPSRFQTVTDRIFRACCQGFAWAAMAVAVFIVLWIGFAAWPAMRQYGFGFLTGEVWDPNKKVFSILPEIWGTLYSSVFALILGTVFGLAAAVFLAEGFMSDAVFALLKTLKLESHDYWGALPAEADKFFLNLIELLAAIPSVVYGLWGLFVVIPLVRPACNWVHSGLGWIPFFGTGLSGPGMLPAVIVLSIMVLPTITAISRGALVAVPSRLRMAAYGLGATRWETILAVTAPSASRGIVGGVVLAFGRALGETMALAMLLGNANVISLSLFSPGNTLAALLANTFPEAGPKDVPVLMYAATVLLAITLFVNALGALILRNATVDAEIGKEDRRGKKKA
jgi:phosphate transport system permease protein